MKKYYIAIGMVAILVAGIYFYGGQQGGSYLSPALVVTDSKGVTHEIRSNDVFNPMAVTVGGVTDPEYVGVNWGIKVVTDVPSNVVVKFRSIMSECGSRGVWDLSAYPDFRPYNDVNGYWTQIVPSGVSDYLYVSGQRDWNIKHGVGDRPTWFWAYPTGGLSGAQHMNNYFTGVADGNYICKWRIYGYATAGDKTANFDVTLPVTMTYVKDRVTTLSVAVSPAQIELK